MLGNNKLMMRKKAMEAMMQEGPSIEIKKRPAGGEMNSEQDGFISFMITPEEKEMILSMRKEGGEGEEEAPEGMPEEEAGNLVEKIKGMAGEY